MLFITRTYQKQAENGSKNPELETEKSEPEEPEFEELCRLFGALSQRDTGRTVVRVFRVVVTQSDPDRGIGSSEIAQMEQINRLTALHHLNRLAGLGLVEKRSGRYFMRDFEQVLDDFEAHALEEIRRARQIAREFER